MGKALDAVPLTPGVDPFSVVVLATVDAEEGGDVDDVDIDFLSLLHPAAMSPNASSIPYAEIWRRRR